MNELGFAEPQWVHLIWAVVALVAVLVWLDQLGSRRLDRFISPLMQQKLATRPRRWRRLLRIFLLGLSGMCLVVALMRPQSGTHRVSMPRLGAQVMVCLDVSKSMLAEDVAPNRLRRAKAEILDLLAYLEPDHVGLIAFAGKATVLCPLTPDFGFLRLVLESVGPHSVARGGTNLEAPIRKAVDGFRGQADLSRAIILITDGEDHDSFAAEAAEYAAERGVRIIAIGLGDKVGSQVQVTNPTTGARTRLLNAAGEPVLTRLKGDMLSKIALTTDGVYIPAETGALDLKSIYDAHIAPLTRGRLEDRGRLVKRDRYQWAVLSALLCLVTAAIVAGARPASLLGPAAGRRKPVAAAAAIVMAWAAALPAAQAQSHRQPPAQPVAEPHQLDQMDDEVLPADSGQDADTDVDPRLLYNEAVAMFRDDDLDQAEAKFSLCRRRSGSDGTARYRSTYNLGWIEVKRADKLIKEQPQEALTHLRTAAEWFREAVSLQKDEPAPRQNLEIIARRAMALADALSKQKQRELAAQLEELIKRQRELIAACRGTVQRVASLGQPTIPDHLRSEFRTLEVTQRQIMSYLSEIAQSARDEAQGLEETEKDKRTAEQGLRLAQLAVVEAYLYQAAQRVGQTRRHLRGRQAQRAYRRASLALGEMKRARDQLRNLVELLGSLVQDAATLTQQTAILASAAGLVPGDGQEQHKPQWLTSEHVAESLATIRARNDELAARIEMGLAHGAADSDESDNNASSTAADSQETQDPHRQDLLVLLQQAVPLVQGAGVAFAEADADLKSQSDQDAYLAEARGTAQLIEARELFLDIRGLIEVMYADEKRMQTVLDADKQVRTEPLSEFLPLLADWTVANAQRAHRLEGQIDRELDKIEGAAYDDVPAAPHATPSGTGPDAGPQGETNQLDSARAAQRQQLEHAKRLMAMVVDTFGDTAAHLDQLNGHEVDVAAMEPLRDSVHQGVEQLEALRRLFFSIVEHLRETARRQEQVADETRDVALLTEAEQIKTAVGPLVRRQVGLRSISQQIAESLQKQSERAPPSGASAEMDSDAARNSQQMAHQLQQAGQRVEQAMLEMDQVVEAMSDDTIDLTAAHDSQRTAVQKLLEALELLAPPPPLQQDKQPKDDQDQQQQGDEANKDDPPRQQKMDMNRLLQGVRDRDAQRQRQKRRGQTSRYEPVTKDW